MTRQQTDSPKARSRARRIAVVVLVLIVALVAVMILLEPWATRNPAHGTAQQGNVDLPSEANVRIDGASGSPGRGRSVA